MIVKPERPELRGARSVRETLEAKTREGKGFHSMADRVRGERAIRRELASRAIPYGIPFLNDALRGILPTDLVLIGAETGIGKTELVQSIAMGAALAGRTVHYFALEGHVLELEQRTKFKIMSELAMLAGRDLDGFTYADWQHDRCVEMDDEFGSEAEYEVAQRYANFKTYYKDRVFGPDELIKYFNLVHHETDLLVVDHLHYVDVSDENENRGVKHVMQVIRDTSLGIGKPVILVVHLKKLDKSQKSLVPDIGSIHGSSEISKICTHSIMLARAYGQPYHPWLSPTYMAVSKDRISGAPGVVALCEFDRRRRFYVGDYTLGRAKHGTDIFVPLDLADVPRWAKNHVPLVGDPAANDPKSPSPLDDDRPPPQEELFEEA